MKALMMAKAKSVTRRIGHHEENKSVGIRSITVQEIKIGEIMKGIAINIRSKTDA